MFTGDLKNITMVTVNFSLKGKVALITGGSRGIGRAIALAFAEAGAKVAISARKQQDLDAVADEINSKGQECLPTIAHVAKMDESRALLNRVKSHFGRIDILVNNAGTNPYNGPLIDAEEWAWDIIMNVNLKGPFMLSLMAAKLMREQGGGNIINMASATGIRPSDFHIYGVSKAALIMLTQIMAREFGQYNIRVNAIAPGIITTRLSESLWKEPQNKEEIIKHCSLGRLGVPEDIAGAAIYLASDASKYVTGTTIIIDGGEKN
ncbi:MAG: SDR family oxidoreductase [Dehalococcoidales bacterium]|nr:SDR family oxidoreductase [Dehalococcoidales bacterium]